MNGPAWLACCCVLQESNLQEPTVASVAAKQACLPCQVRDKRVLDNPQDLEERTIVAASVRDHTMPEQKLGKASALLLNSYGEASAS